MSEEDTETKTLRDEVYALKQRILQNQTAHKDKLLSEVCSDLSTAPKLKLQTKRILRGHIHKVNAIDFANDDRHLLSGSLDGKLIIWDTWSGSKVQIIPLKSSWVLSVCFSPSGQFVGMDNMVTVFDLNNKDAEDNTKILRELGFEGFLNSCQFLNDKKLLTASAEPKITSWDLAKGLPVLELRGHTGDIPCISLKPKDENIFVTGSLDQTAKLWDLRTKGAVQTFWGHSGDINGVFFHPMGTTFCSASDDNTAKLFDIRSDQEVAVFEPPASDDEGLTSCIISNGGRYLLAGHADSGIQVWDLLKAEHVGVLVGHESRVTALSLSPNGISIGSSSWDNCIRLWL